MSRERENRDRVQGIPLWQRGSGIWYADFRVYRHGSRESLGTKDRTEAEERLAERKRELEEADEIGSEVAPDPRVEDYFQRYLQERKNEIAESTWKNEERALGVLAGWLTRRLGRQPKLSDITLSQLRSFKAFQLELVKASTFNVRLTAISQALQRAFEEGIVPRNEAKRLRRPRNNRTEEVWLEIGEAARVMEAAREMENDPQSRCYKYLHAIIATYLLTGARRSEVFGLEVNDISFHHGEVRIQPNEWRELKTRHSERVVPLWSQLQEILSEHVGQLPEDSPLLFPSRDGTMLKTLRWSLRAIEDRAGLEKHLTLKVFRHTYTAARIQTTDQGRPIALYTVARELGHTGVDRIRNTYGHLQRRRHRSEEVRYDETDVVDLESRRRVAGEPSA